MPKQKNYCIIMLIIASAGVQKDKSLRKIKLRLFKLHCTTEEVLKTENISKKIKNEKSNASMSGPLTQGTDMGMGGSAM